MSNQASYATDEECQELRRQLIEAGRIKPSSERPDAGPKARDVVLPAKRPATRTNVSQIPEEGAYEVRPIVDEAQYARRLAAYLYMLQSILRTRIELGMEDEARPRKQK